MENFSLIPSKSKNFFHWFLLLWLTPVITLIIGLVFIFNLPTSKSPLDEEGIVKSSILKFTKFASCADLNVKLQEFRQKLMSKEVFLMPRLFEMRPMAEFAPMKSMMESQGFARSGSDYSLTNIQVAGVDEADIVKTDGQYLYTLSHQGKTISIMRAYPPSEAEIISQIKNSNPDAFFQEFFIENDFLLVFGQQWMQIQPEKSISGELTPSPEIAPVSEYASNFTFVEIYDLSDRHQPVLKRKLELEGNYHSSRKIGSYVYFVLNNYLRADLPQPIPFYRELKNPDQKKDFQPICDCVEVNYFEPLVSPGYLIVIGLEMTKPDAEITKEVIFGASENIYASLNNLYVANTIYDQPEIEIQGRKFIALYPKIQTNLYKFALNPNQTPSIRYLTQGQVPGRVLNQFSMDEYENYFRLATTSDTFESKEKTITTSNNIYVLDMDLKIFGKIENIAPGESIYSARFMGKKGYLVTFQKIDPFFTFDLSDPAQPKIIGELKIPGYSDYLHPYDENHIIGIGKEAVEGEGDFAWFQGMKMALFDVTDFANPKELHKVMIGDRGTDSLALYNHKAFLFSREKNLLVLPILLAEISEEEKKNPQTPRWTYGKYTFQGSYVYQLSPEKGFDLKGRITHYDKELSQEQEYLSDENLNIKRNLYIGQNLYSVSDQKVLINSLDDLKLLKVINIYEYDKSLAH